ncbi:RidA family protein [Rhodocaloribacter litoris]|uniref:RidA family protein n=1 Tax=Rhodocaloribacter litoris TaxID=2558931 RepID=UPI0023431758|nr:RidA family protein [Rhodocaloribacter litoris]
MAVLAGCTTPAPETVPDGGRSVVATGAAPAAVGPYSQAVRVGNLLFLAGQIGLDPATGQLVEGGVVAETRQAMENLRAVLEAAGFSMADVVQAQVFLADLNDYAAMNEVYASFFDGPPPARAAVEVARLPRDARVEIMMTAAR